MLKKEICKKIDNLSDLLIKFNNIERKHSSACEQVAKDYEKENLKLKVEMQAKDEIIINQEKEIQRLDKLLKTKEKESKKLHEYLEKVAEILKSSQEKIIQRKKITKADFIADGMMKIDETTKERLK